MPLSGYDLGKAVADALQENFIDSKAYLEKNAPEICNEIIGDAILGYLCGKLSITYTWDAKNLAAPGTPADPDTSFEAEISLSGEGALVPSGLRCPDAFPKLLEDIATLIKEGIAISPPPGFAVAPLSFAAAGAIAAEMRFEREHVSFWNNMGCAIVNSIKESFENPAPAAGTHGAYTGMTTGMAIACEVHRPWEMAPPYGNLPAPEEGQESGASPQDGSSSSAGANEEQDEGSSTGAGSASSEGPTGQEEEEEGWETWASPIPGSWLAAQYKMGNSGDELAPDEVRIQVPGIRQSGALQLILFRRAITNVTRNNVRFIERYPDRPRSLAYVCQFMPNRSIHLTDSGNEEYAWQLAHDNTSDPWSIMRVLARSRPVIWLFFRELCVAFPNIRQIDITSLTRPGNDVHGWGLAVDIGAIHFVGDTPAIVYDRQKNGDQYIVGSDISVPDHYRTIHEAVRDWIWGLGRGYVEAYLDPWWIRYANSGSWGPNPLLSSIEWGHRHHLHLTFAES